ncbi:LOW QUALITY PROTEIN: protein phosphatase 2C-like domain-containing protein 1 [Sylvia borin]
MQNEVREAELMGETGARSCSGKNGEHSTSNVEKTLQNGGNISTNKRLVEGYPRTTRVLGHQNSNKKHVTPVPHIASVPISVTCHFLILASNGLGVLDYLNHENDPKIDKTIPSNSDSNTQLAEKMDSNSFCDTAGDVGQELLKTVSLEPLGSKSPLQFENNTKTYLINCILQAAEETQRHCNATSHREQLAKTALAAGSRDNITILTILLNGCDKIPNDFNI